MAKTLKAPHWWQALSVNVFGTTHAIVGGLATVPDEHAPVLEGFGFRPHDVAPPVVPDVAPAAPAEQLSTADQQVVKDEAAAQVREDARQAAK